jgi:hypothetical protein
VGAYVVYRVATTLLRGMDMNDIASVVNWAWLAVVIYTWVGPVFFQRMLSKELEKVKLEKTF